MIVTATSAANQCLYCVVAHGAILRIYEKKPLVADQVAVNYRKADIALRQRAMLDFAMKVCLRSHEVGDADFADAARAWLHRRGRVGHRLHHRVLRAVQPHRQLFGHAAQPRVLPAGPRAEAEVALRPARRLEHHRAGVLKVGVGRELEIRQVLDDELALRVRPASQKAACFCRCPPLPPRNGHPTPQQPFQGWACSVACPRPRLDRCKSCLRFPPLHRTGASSPASPPSFQVCASCNLGSQSAISFSRCCTHSSRLATSALWASELITASLLTSVQRGHPC